MTPIEGTEREPDAREQYEKLLAFLERARRFWHVPLLALLAGAIAFAVFLQLRTPRFRSETVILYAERGSSDTAEASGSQRNAGVRLRELLLSRPKLERLILDHDLYPEVRRKYGMGEALEELKRDIDFRAPGGDTFSIAFQGTTPRQAQRVTEQLANTVIDGDASLRKEQAKVARDFLANEKQGAETLLRETEQKLASFMAVHPRFALDAAPLSNGAAIRATLGGPVGAPPAPAPNSWSARAQALGPAAASKVLAPAAPGAPAAAPSDADEARARAALAAAREHLNQQLTRYTAAHPDVRAAEAAVQSATARLNALAAAPKIPVPIAAPAAVAPLASGATPAPAPVRRAAPVAGPAPAVAKDPGERARDLVDLETEWLQLTRAVTEARQRRDQIEAQLFRADIRAGSEAVGHGVQVSVIDPPFLPDRPLPPGKTTLGLIFGGLALALGCLLAAVLAAIDERIFRARDAAGVVEVLAEIPQASTRRAHVAG